MKFKVIGLIGLGWLAFAGLAGAQSEKPQATSISFTIVFDPRRVYEDIEIMRRVLDRTLTKLRNTPADAPYSWACTRDDHLASAAKCASCHSSFNSSNLLSTAPVGGGVPIGAGHSVSPSDSPEERLWYSGRGADANRATERRDVEGAYFRGYGVVFSVTLPVHQVKTAPATAKAPQPSPTEWERARSELRGEKIEAEDKKPEQPRTSLTEAVLKALAENGHHVSQLTDKNERVTVAITLRPMDAGSKTFDWTTQPAQSNRATSDAESHQAYARALSHMADDGATAPLFQSASNYAHLGDMRLKAGRAREAIEAYVNAGEAYQKIIESIRAEPGDEKWKQKMKVAEQAGEAYSKLSQAYLLHGDADRAFQVLKRAAELSGWARSGKGDGKPSAAGEESAKMPLPAKLIISAPKQLLDDVAAEKITFEAFKKAAEVQYLAFPSAPKPSTKPAATGSAPAPPATPPPAGD